MQVASDDYGLAAGQSMSVVQASSECLSGAAPLPCQFMRSVPGLLVCALFAIVVGAPMARADATDDAFISTLQQKGVTVADRDAAIAAGHSVCVAFGQGGTRAAVVKSLLADGFSAQDAGRMMAVSVAVYCPKYRSAVDPTP
jgi:Protein of unknown function (DUF732)